MRQRLSLAGQDPDAVNYVTESLTPLAAAPSPSTAFARARKLKQGLENQARSRRN